MNTQQSHGITLPPPCVPTRCAYSSVQVCRNYFGAQKSSFEVPLDTSVLEVGSEEGKPGWATNKTPYPAVFIRAPAVLEVGRSRPRSLCFPCLEQEGQRRARKIFRDRPGKPLSVPSLVGFSG